MRRLRERKRGTPGAKEKERVNPGVTVRALRAFFQDDMPRLALSGKPESFQEMTKEKQEEMRRLYGEKK